MQIMNNYSKTKNANHERADVDSFYECSYSLAQNVDGDNEEYVVDLMESTELTSVRDEKDSRNMEQRYMNNSNAEATIPDGFVGRYHFGRRRSVSTSGIMDLELARTFDNVQLMIASYKKESDSEDTTPISTPKANTKFHHSRQNSAKLERKLSQRRQRSPCGNPMLSVEPQTSTNQTTSPQSPVALRRNTGGRSDVVEANAPSDSPNKKRSSILVHENEDLLNLADEVHFREIFLATRSINSTPDSSGINLSAETRLHEQESNISKEESLKSLSTVRRNSSGYSTSSGGSTISSASNRDAVEAKNETKSKDNSSSTASSVVVVRKEQKYKSNNMSLTSVESHSSATTYAMDGRSSVSYSGSKKKDISLTPTPQQKTRVTGKRSVSPRNQSRYKTVPVGDEPQEIKQFQQSFLKNRRASVCAANVHTNQQFIQDYKAAQLKQEKESSQRTSVGHRLSNIFTTKHRESPSAKKIERKIAMERQKSQEQNQNERHKEFVQTRSKTGINSFFSRRRQSIAITDDAYNSALRAAKSHYDLSLTGNQGDNVTGDTRGETKQKRESLFIPQTSPQLSPAKVPSAIPLHLQIPYASGTASAASTPTTRMKFGLKERPWTELERLWKAKAKDPPGPNIEFMLKPHVSFACDRKGNEMRALTLPIEPGDVREAERSLGTASNHRPLTTSDSLPQEASNNKQRLSSDKPLRSRTIKGYLPRQTTTDLDLAIENTTQGNLTLDYGVSASEMLGQPTGVVVTAPSPRLHHHHRRTPSGSMISNWLASHTSEKSTNGQHTVFDHFHSPFVVRKAVDLLAPNVIHDWQSQRGYYRGVSVPPENLKIVSSRDERPQHFRELLDHW